MKILSNTMNATVKNRSRWLRPSALLFLTFFSFLSYGDNNQDPLIHQVTIYRDTYGVPHIVGETEEATFFGYGYAQAQDHLEQMMLQYRDAQGRIRGLMK